MIPNYTFTPEPVYGQFLYLQDLPYDPLEQKVMGGIALNDPSRGRLYREWTVRYINNTIEVNPGNEPVVFSFAAEGVLTVSLSFDNNMSVVLCWTTLTGGNLYYYDVLTSQYTVREFPGITSCKVCVDDPREFYTGQSDVIFGYTLNGNLCYRQQRDRYDIERVIAPTARLLSRMGPTTANRLQFETV